MKLKQIYELLLEIIKLLQEKRNQAEKDPKYPKESLAFTEGQLFEANYLLNKIEEIIFKK